MSVIDKKYIQERHGKKMERIKRCYLLCICLVLLLQSGGSELVLTAFADNTMKTEQKVLNCTPFVRQSLTMMITKAG